MQAGSCAPCWRANYYSSWQAPAQERKSLLWMLLLPTRCHSALVTHWRWQEAIALMGAVNGLSPSSLWVREMSFFGSTSFKQRGQPCQHSLLFHVMHPGNTTCFSVVISPGWRFTLEMSKYMNVPCSPVVPEPFSSPNECFVIGGWHYPCNHVKLKLGTAFILHHWERSWDGLFGATRTTDLVSKSCQ